ncbi:class A sortase [Bacillus pseudomycoides]|uniref:class A sortase n=1 Tax=Bacillus pseudomycoides TaxID=64104 RepID=UPI000BEDE33D|nr:class A sortase [Bacillus pseudomycoides]PDY08115.1 class A sortase [Bacillus pseudomycoides]
MKKIIFFVILLFIGIGLYFYPTYEKQQTVEIQKEHINEFQKEKQPFEENIVTKEMDASNLNRVTFEEVKNAKFTKKNSLAKLTIPKFNFSIPIYANATEKHLLIGAVTLKNNQVLENGNYALAGHNMSRSGVLFSDIPKLKEGDIITIEDNHKQYKYKVNTNKVVSPNNGEVLEEDGQNKLTLITCLSIKDNSKRVVVTANLEEIKEKVA